MFTLHSNQYIPYRPKSLPSGMPACATYYYFLNEKKQVVDKTTLKPYKGKQMERYAMKDKVAAEAYLEVINKDYSTDIKIGLERYPEFKLLVDDLTFIVCERINTYAPHIKSEMPYKTQFVLEELIKKLEERV